MVVVRAIEILLVEDNPGDVLLTKTALKKAKMKNTLNVVPNGEEAMAYLRHEGQYVDSTVPDMVLLDLNLPRLSGHEVLGLIKEDPVLKTIPVIVLTTSSNYDDILSSYSHHANAYITKPVNMDDLFETIKAFENFWLAIVTLPVTKTD